MADLPPELATFAARLEIEPEAVETIFQYCRAMVLVAAGQAKPVRVELRDREVWCTFRLLGGEEFIVLRPSLNQAEERQFIDILWEIYHSGKVRPDMAKGMLVIPKNTGKRAAHTAEYILEDSMSPTSNEERELAAVQPAVVPDGIDAEQPSSEVAVKKRTRGAGKTRLSAEETRELAERLQQVTAQAQIAAEELRAILAEVQQATEAAWAATKEQRLVLGEMRAALRQYERLYREPEQAALLKRPMEDRNRQITLAVVKGMTLSEVGRKFGLGSHRVKDIYDTQMRRLYRLPKSLDLSPEDLTVINNYKRTNLRRRENRQAHQISLLLQKMWDSEDRENPK